MTFNCEKIDAGLSAAFVKNQDDPGIVYEVFIRLNPQGIVSGKFSIAGISELSQADFVKHISLARVMQPS